MREQYRECILRSGSPKANDPDLLIKLSAQLGLTDEDVRKDLDAVAEVARLEAIADDPHAIPAWTRCKSEFESARQSEQQRRIEADGAIHRLGLRVDQAYQAVQKLQQARAQLARVRQAHENLWPPEREPSDVPVDDVNVDGEAAAVIDAGTN
ncbi:MAG: hypothetical protein JXQ73_02470 [Phycisphaerae bacterium]|nr:hypothetical protein [Phycisphaerae bacterium]